MNAALAVDILPPQPPLSLAEKSTLSAYDARIRSASAQIKRSSCEIAYFGWRIKKANRWPEFGCADEIEYFTSRGISASLWSTAMIVGQLLEPLSLEELTAIGIHKGKLLSNVHADLWHDYDWLGDAKRMSEVDFRQIVTLRNRTLDGAEASEALLAAEAEAKSAITRQRVEYLRKKYNLDSSVDAMVIALREADTTATIELAKAARRANKLLTLSQQTIRSGRIRTKYGKYVKGRQKEVHADVNHMIETAKKWLYEALACAVTIQSKTD